MLSTSEEQKRSRGVKPARTKTTRGAHLRRLLRRKQGATTGQIQKAFGWKPHTVRAAISAQRKSGCEIARRDTDKGSVYRIVKQGGDE